MTSSRLPSKQRHQFSGIRSFGVKSLVDLYEVCVLQLSTDGLQLAVRLVNNSGLYFRQGFGLLIPLSDSWPDLYQTKLSILHFFSHFVLLVFPSSISLSFWFIIIYWSQQVPAMLFHFKPLHFTDFNYNSARSPWKVFGVCKLDYSYWFKFKWISHQKESFLSHLIHWIPSESHAHTSFTPNFLWILLIPLIRSIPSWKSCELFKAQLIKLWHNIQNWRLLNNDAVLTLLLYVIIIIFQHV